MVRDADRKGFFESLPQPLLLDRVGREVLCHTKRQADKALHKPGCRVSRMVLGWLSTRRDPI